MNAISAPNARELRDLNIFRRKERKVIIIKWTLIKQIELFAGLGQCALTRESCGVGEGVRSGESEARLIAERPFHSYRSR